MMLALWLAVTLPRPFATAYSNARRTIRSLPYSLIVLIEMPLSSRIRWPVRSPMNAISSFAATDPCSNSMPVYWSSVFSRTTTRSIASYTLGTPGYRRHGRMQAYRSSACRRATLTLPKRQPAGLETGPLSATPVSRIEASVESGSGVPSPGTAARPSSRTSHSTSTPVDSIARRAAPTTSGPMPSPGIRVTRWGTPLLSPRRREPQVGGPGMRPERRRSILTKDRGPRPPSRWRPQRRRAS